MRAYLCGTAPYQNIPLEKRIDWEAGDADGNVITTENQHAAHNHLQYLILHLICLMENESFGKHKHLDSDVVSRGIIGSMGGFTDVVFIWRDLVHVIQSASEAVSKDLKVDPPASSEEYVHLYQQLLRSFEHIWEAFIAPGGGLLDSLLHSKNT
eukprot:3287715-Ditylum_brightwellii.AAC.1